MRAASECKEAGVCFLPRSAAAAFPPQASTRVRCLYLEHQHGHGHGHGHEQHLQADPHALLSPAPSPALALARRPRSGVLAAGAAPASLPRRPLWGRGLRLLHSLNRRLHLGPPLGPHWGAVMCAVMRAVIPAGCGSCAPLARLVASSSPPLPSWLGFRVSGSGCIIVYDISACILLSYVLICTLQYAGQLE